MNVSRKIIAMWDKLFLEERPIISLSFFRIFVALTVGLHVIPSFFHMDDNYLSSALKTANGVFFPAQILDLVAQSPDWLVWGMMAFFNITCFFFLIGLFSQVSCILMTLACYYFYALNDFHIGTLSWDILLVTLFLMCVSAYHGDYFSVDAIRRGNVDAYKIRRPFFIQRLLQLQIASTYFYTALYKITAQGNWISGNPILALMQYPPQGVTKNFLLKEWMASQPALCYWIGIFIVVMELLLPLLLFIPKTRRSAIMLGIIFHITLILTLDVPAIFFFLFPAQLLLFINPEKVLAWIESRRRVYQGVAKIRLVYDGQCQFCRNSVNALKVMDLWGQLSLIDLHLVADLKGLNPQLDKQKLLSQMHLLEEDGSIYAGFFAFRRLSLRLPMLYPLLPVLYLPLMGFLGQAIYQWIAQHRHLFYRHIQCADNHCRLS